MAGNSEVDAYVADAKPFARPILTELRDRIHAALPEVEEGIKWGMPHFMIGGKNVAGISAYKAHCAIYIHGEGETGRGVDSFGKLKSLDDLPSDQALKAKLLGRRDQLDKAG